MNARGSALLLLASLSACGSRSGLLDEGLPFPVGGTASFDGGLALDGEPPAPPVDAGSADSGHPLPDAGFAPGVLLFGGQDPDASQLADTWVWTAAGWTQKAVTGPVPTARWGHTLVSWKGGALLFGGTNGSSNANLFSDTWQWDGTGWHELVASGGPSSTFPMAAAELNGTVVALAVDFGPSGPKGGGAPTMVYTEVWDGTSWTASDIARPPAVYNASMATLGGRAIWAGAGQTWAWDGSAWSGLVAPSPSDSSSFLAPCMTAVGSNVVWFAPAPQVATYQNQTFGGTAVWNGSAWTALGIAGPSPRDAPAMAATPDEAVLFGGVSPDGVWLDDTWSWDGAEWTRVNVPGPPPRASAAMAGVQVPLTP